MKEESEPVSEHFLCYRLRSERKKGKNNTMSTILPLDFSKPSDNRSFIINKGMCRTRVPSKDSSHSQSF